MNESRFSLSERSSQNIVIIIGLLTALVTFIATVIDKFVDKRGGSSVLTSSKPPTGNKYEYILLLEIIGFLVLWILYLIITKRRSIRQRELKELEIKAFIDNLNLHIDEKPLMSINSENLYRVFNNDDFILEDSINTVTLEGTRVQVEFESRGTRVKDNNPGYIFNIGLDSFVPYDNLTCVAYDLKQDQQRQYPIRPLLKSKDSSFKQVLIPFSRRVALEKPFHVYILWESFTAISPGIDYHGCTLFHNNSTLRTNQEIILQFFPPYPKWVRVYEAVNGKMELMKPLNAYTTVGEMRVYVDKYENIELKKSIAYLFER